MRTALVLLGMLVVLVGAVLAWLVRAASSPSGRGLRHLEGAEVVSLKNAPRPAVPRALKVVTWNIAFGGGVSGQPTDLHTREEVLRNLEGIAEALQVLQPDVVFLQEVDREARRSGDLDQFAWLLEHAGLPHGCFVDTWDVRYVPHPGWWPARHLGRVRSGQAILSRFPIRQCRREPLPQPREAPWWYRPFFLHRALQWADLDLGDGTLLTAVNVHLEAFFGDNRMEQARRLARALGQVARERPLLVGGDFNTTPPTATVRAGFPDEPETDFEGDRSLQEIRGVKGLREVFLDDAPEAPEAASWTFPASAPNRRLDYLFYRGFEGSTQRAVPRWLVSDHRPVEAALRRLVPPEPAGKEAP